MATIMHAAEPVVLNVAAFGAAPDSGKDACPAVAAALERAKTIGKPVTIRFPKGRYDFYKAGATSAHHPVTAVHQQWDHVTPLYLNGLTKEDTRFTPGTGVMSFNLQTRTVVPGQYPHRNVNIVGNRFINNEVHATAIKASGISGLNITGNTCETNWDQPHLVTVFGCENVKIAGNTRKTATQKARILYGQMDEDEIDAAPIWEKKQ